MTRGESGTPGSSKYRIVVSTFFPPDSEVLIVLVSVMVAMPAFPYRYLMGQELQTPLAKKGATGRVPGPLAI